MIYQQAYEGVKKLLVSETLYLTSSVFAFTATLLIAVTSKMGETDAMPLLLGAGLLMIVSLVISIVATIMEIIGLAKAKRNESLFKTALGFAVAGVFANVGAVLTSGMFSNICSGINEAFVLLVSIYMVLGFYSLALRLDNTAVIRVGKAATIVIAVIFAFAILDRVVSLFVPRLDDMMDVACAVLEIVAEVVLLIYLALSKKMLAKGTAE